MGTVSGRLAQGSSGEAERNFVGLALRGGLRLRFGRMRWLLLSGGDDGGSREVGEGPFGGGERGALTVWTVRAFAMMGCCFASGHWSSAFAFDVATGAAGSPAG